MEKSAKENLWWFVYGIVGILPFYGIPFLLLLTSIKKKKKGFLRIIENQLLLYLSKMSFLVIDLVRVPAS